jgi:hypothetical protein
MFLPNSIPFRDAVVLRRTESDAHSVVSAEGSITWIDRVIDRLYNTPILFKEPHNGFRAK